MKNICSKLLCLIAILLPLTLAGCSSARELAGTYTIVSMESGGETLTARDITDSGKDPKTVYLTLNEDGTGTLCIFGQLQKMAWTKDRIWPVGQSDQAVPLKLEGDTLTMGEEGQRLVFER